jgi:hypothetical protein
MARPAQAAKHEETTMMHVVMIRTAYLYRLSNRLKPTLCQKINTKKSEHRPE